MIFSLFAFNGFYRLCNHVICYLQYYDVSHSQRFFNSKNAESYFWHKK